MSVAFYEVAFIYVSFYECSVLWGSVWQFIVLKVPKNYIHQFCKKKDMTSEKESLKYKEKTCYTIYVGIIKDK